MTTTCHYGSDWWAFYGSVDYECSVQSISIQERNTTVTSSMFRGEHEDGRSNDDVELLSFENTIVHYIPRGLKKVFPRMTILDISYCGLKEVFRTDLVGLETLEQLYITHNDLRTLPNDLLVGMSKLSRISFNNNRLENISSEVLKPIMKNELTYVGFVYNTIIDASFGNESHDIEEHEGKVDTLQDLMDLIDTTWKKNVVILKNAKFALNVSNGLEELWTSGRYSDFTITTVNLSQPEDAKKFQVHKSVLAAQSPVLTVAFDVDMKERQTSEMKIFDFDARTVEGFLRYCYTGQVQDKENAMNLFEIASKYDVSQLMSVCEDIVVENIDESNIYKVFCLGKLHPSSIMKYSAFEKIQQMFPEKELKDLINDPESLEKLLEANRTRKRKIQKAEEEFNLCWEMCMKSD